MITEQMKREVLEYMEYRLVSYTTRLYTYASKYMDIDETLDLNFLFEVAEKVGIKEITIQKQNDVYYVAVETQARWYEFWELVIAEALFLALYQAIKSLGSERKSVTGTKAGHYGLSADAKERLM